MVKVEGHLAMLQEKVAESEEANATLRAEVRLPPPTPKLLLPAFGCERLLQRG